MIVLNVAEEDPPSTVLLGTVSVGEAGATINCGFERMVNEACARALRAGGNILKLTEVEPPSVSSSCYQITADILFASDLNATERLLQQRATAAAKSRLPDGTLYSLLHIYCPDYSGGPTVGYDLRLNDSVVYRARNNSRVVVRLVKPGPVTIWSKTAGTETLFLQVEFGQEYFVRCGLEGNIVVHRPAFQFVDPVRGRREFEEIPDRP